MILPFQIWHKRKPTFFAQKILFGLYEKKLMDWQTYDQYSVELIDHLPAHYDHDEILKHEKYTTIRKGEKWSVGQSIHFIIYNQNPKRYQFAPVLQAKRVEPIEFTFDEVTYKRAIQLGDKFIYHQTYDEIFEYDDRFTLLWKQEGFETEEAFWDWFKEPFKGQLIYWTH